jgi:peptide/nickel transport system permease protein
MTVFRQAFVRGAMLMVRLVFRAMATLGGTIFLASSGIFLLIHLSGDPTYGFLPPETSPELRSDVRARLGLDEPILRQYARFLKDAFTLDFGYSWSLRRPAETAVLGAFPSTMLLAVLGTVSAIVLGIGAGVLSSRRRRGAWEWMVSATTLIGLAIPGFWLGTLLILLFAVRLGWLPSSGNVGWQALVLPVAALTLAPASVIARLVRANMRDVSGAAYVRTAHAKGISPRAVQWRHMLPNAIMPAIAYVGVHAAALIGGTIVIESVFAYPGVGRMALQAALQRDMPVIHAFVVFTAMLVVGINLIVDLAAALVDPRLRVTGVLHAAR